MQRALSTALVVEDEPALRQQLVRLLERRGYLVQQAATVKHALAVLSPPPDLLLLDVRLGDESGVDVARHAATLQPAPITIAISGNARNEEAFALAKVGVRVFLTKPFGSDTLTAAIDRALSEAPNIEAIAVTAVGIKTLKEAQRELREAMLKQALALEKTQGRAGSMLGMTRQAVGHMLQRDRKKVEDD